MDEKIILLIGPSGSGKTTVARYLESHYKMKSIHSYTTRAPRYPGEEGHTFVTNAEFDNLKDFVAYTEFDGHRYGATVQQVEEADIYVIDLTGARTFQSLYHGRKNVLIVYLDVHPDTCFQRMLNRGDGRIGAARRVSNDTIAFDGAKDYLKDMFDHVLILQDNTVPEIARMIAEFSWAGGKEL